MRTLAEPEGMCISMSRKELFARVVAYFEKHRPFAETELHYKDPFQLLVAVILSAQCTDKRVNLVTPRLFGEFPNPGSMAEASPDTILPLIRSISYPNNKARHLAGMARMLMEQFNGTVPSEVEELQRLPGVGRKTANVIASVVYHKPALAVDTHVHRVAARIGLTRDAKTPLATEKQLLKYIPADKRAIAHHWLILHGRYVCRARRPLCETCGLIKICRYQAKSLRTD